MGFEDEYLDVLQNLEFALLSTCQEHPELCDHDVLRVVEAAIAFYQSLDRDPPLPMSRLSLAESKMFERVKSICDWRLGKIPPPMAKISDSVISIEEILLCLKRIKKSIGFWTRKGGRRGYITFASPHALLQ